jgi:hypothetical protein
MCERVKGELSSVAARALEQDQLVEDNLKLVSGALG